MVIYINISITIQFPKLVHRLFDTRLNFYIQECHTTGPMHYSRRNAIQNFFGALCISTALLLIDVGSSNSFASAFVPSKQFHHGSSMSIPANEGVEIITKDSPGVKSNLFLSSHLRLSSSDDSNGDTAKDISYSHAEVSWKIKPWLKINNADNSGVRKVLSKLSNLKERIILRGAANLIRLDCKIKGESPPKVLCPKSGQAVLEAFIKRDKGIGSKFIQIVLSYFCFV